MKQFLAILILALMASASLRAQEITAGLSSNEAQVGEPIQLVVTVRGGRGASVPETLSVNGLHITLFGRSTQFEMRNLTMTSTATYTYRVVPQFEGEFTIPSFDVTLDGKKYPTQAMRLSVSGSATIPQVPSLPQNAPPLPQGIPSGQVAGTSQSGRPYFGELILSKKSAYVGEVVPIELRFYFNARVGGEVGERPGFSGEGFTVQKFSNGVKREQVVNGSNYVVFSFKSSITPAKSGEIEIPAAFLEARLRVPGKVPQGFDDFFSQMIPQGMFNETQDVKIETVPQTLEVTALPKDGRPDDFSGAVGKFTMNASVSPKKASGGEPVTMRVTVAGQGNFEGMSAPVLTGDEGWRTYPPSDKFRATDEVGFTGEKSYEFPIIARQDQTRTPGVRFSYFNPSTGKYATLTQDPLPVDAKAGSSPAATAAAPTTAQQSAPPAAATPAVTPDITAMAGGASSWTSLIFRREFLAANAVLALTWLALVAAFSFRRFSASAVGRSLARRKLAARALAGLRGTEPDAFYGEVSRFLALHFNVPDQHAALAARIAALPPETQAPLRAALDRLAESKFAAGGAPAPAAADRDSLIATLKTLRHEK